MPLYIIIITNIITNIVIIIKIIIIIIIIIIITIFIIILRHIETWKAKSSSQIGAFFTRCLPIELALKRCWLVLNVNFFHQIFGNLPYNATEILKFLKTFKTWVFFKKK